MNKTQINEIFNTAVKALLLNKLRTFLTMLGVIIGVFAVVSLVSLVKGVENFVQDQFESLGSNLSFVYPGSGGLANDPAVSFTDNKLEQKHVELIEREAGGIVEAVTPITVFYKNTIYKTRSYYAVLTGAPPNYEYTNNLLLESGRFFTPLENKSHERVAVLGPEVKSELFGRSNPVGESIKIEDKTYKVIGVMQKKGPDWDEQIVIPMKTLEKEFGAENYTYIMIKFFDDSDIDSYTKKIELALMKDLKAEDFTIYSQSDLLESFQSILDIIKIGLGAVAGISLFVGGIGIMNIMLVSVRERIREIGLRKALGATKSNIAFQFIIESILISIVGGVIGLLFGWFATLIAQNWLRAQITPWSVILAFGFSLLVGVVFGTYPAIDAGKKDPVEALRYE